MINGAKEFHIPDNYINFLKSFQHNGYEGEIDVSFFVDFGVHMNN